MGKKKNKLSKSLFNTIIRWSTTKYGVVTIIFVAWLGFFDQHDVFTKYKLKKTIADLEFKIDRNHHLVELAKQEKIDLEENIEKYAREKYFMHKENEDVLIIDTKTETIK